MRTGFRRTALLLTIAVSAGCVVHDTEIPPLTGPSELAMSVTLAAMPDIIVRNGVDTSRVVVTVRDPNGSPVAGAQFRVDTVVGQFYEDFGSLAARFITTGSDGKATVVYTAPPAPPNGAGTVIDIVTIVITTVGANQQSNMTYTAEIRLVPKSIILVPGAPLANFSFTPTAPKARQRVDFSASTSAAEAGHSIVDYAWSWGDGETAKGVLEEHDYVVAGTYYATLTVTDDVGRQASMTKAITVVP
jgi:PKD repeat protein